MADQKFDTMADWNPKIPVGWNGRGSLLPDRDEQTSPIYQEPELHEIAINSSMRSKARKCACGCGRPTPKRDYEYLAYVPGHNKRAHWRRDRIIP